MRKHCKASVSVRREPRVVWVATSRENSLDWHGLTRVSLGCAVRTRGKYAITLAGSSPVPFGAHSRFERRPVSAATVRYERMPPNQNGNTSSNVNRCCEYASYPTIPSWKEKVVADVVFSCVSYERTRLYTTSSG